MGHLIIHWLGIDNVSGRPYAFWSGVGGDAAIFGAITSVPYLQWKRHNCAVRHCWRVGRLTTDGGHVVCHRHMPGGAPTHDDVIAAHNAAREDIPQ